MKISVVIPAYNAEETILAALESVYQQDYVSLNVGLEVIVIDDGSTDHTRDLVESYKDSNNLTNLVLISKINQGVSVARNVGIRQSTGDWIAFLDSDDVWLAGKLHKQIAIIGENPNINFLGCARNNERLRILGRKVVGLYSASCRDLLIKMFPQTSTAIVRRSVFDKVGLYNERMTHSEDGELWVRIASLGGFYYSSESLVITGGGKQNFGESGLSSDLGKMHSGSLQILDMSLNAGIINRSWFVLFYVFYTLKYFRRLILVRLRNNVF